MKPDGIFLSNGPGDPAAVGYAVESARELMRSEAAGVRHLPGPPDPGPGAGRQDVQAQVRPPRRQPPGDGSGTRKVEITSQNHGFAVDVDSMQGRAVLSHVSLNDKTVEGMRHGELPVFSVQYHPEASPGPNDASYLFDRFCTLMQERTPAVADTRRDDLPPPRSPGRALQRARAQAGGDARPRGILRSRGQGVRRRRRAVRGADGVVPRVVRAGASARGHRADAGRVRDRGGAARGPADERRTLAALATSHRSLFELFETSGEVLDVEDLIGGARFAVRERRKPLGIAAGDVFEARLVLGRRDGGVRADLPVSSARRARRGARVGRARRRDRRGARRDPVSPVAPAHPLAPARPRRGRQGLSGCLRRPPAPGRGGAGVGGSLGGGAGGPGVRRGARTSYLIARARPATVAGVDAAPVRPVRHRARQPRVPGRHPVAPSWRPACETALGAVPRGAGREDHRVGAGAGRLRRAARDGGLAGGARRRRRPTSSSTRAAIAPPRPWRTRRRWGRARRWS